MSSIFVQIAAACCVISIAVCTWTAFRVFHSDALSIAVVRGSNPGATPSSSAVKAADTTSDDLIDDALDHDPFSPTRKRPAVRYGVSVQAVTLQPQSVPEPLRLVGTVVDAGGGSFVLCQLGQGSPHVIRVGQKFGLYQLRSISQGTAIFVTGDGQRVELRVPKTGS
jgi:hypothetical protein